MPPADKATSKHKRGGQPGNHNALRHGLYNDKRMAFRAMITAYLDSCSAVFDTAAPIIAPLERPRSARPDAL